MKDSLLEQVRRAVIAVVPEIHSTFTRPERWEYDRPITLADVLQAIGKAGYSNALLTCMIHKDDTFGILDVAWDLTKSLDEQEPEVLDPLHKILCT